jgi:hypothetical protein
VFSLVLEGFKVVSPEAFVSFHSTSWDAGFSAFNDAAIDDFANFITVLQKVYSFLV